MTDATTINWAPPATHYIYNADLYCPDCAKGIERDLIGQGMALCQGSDDSNAWPVPCSRGEGESDTPEHWGKCQRFLGRDLTDDGIAYIFEHYWEDLDRDGKVGEIVQGWMDFYGISID